MRGGSDEVDTSKVQHIHTYEDITMNPISFNYRLSERTFIRIESVADRLSTPPFCAQEDLHKGKRSTWE